MRQNLLKEYYHYCEPDPTIDNHCFWKSANPEKMTQRLDEYIDYFEAKGDMEKVINCLKIKTKIANG
jgi:hypothetical protein